MHIPKSLLDSYPHLQGVIDTTREQVEYAMQQRDRAMEPTLKDFLAQREVILEQVTASRQALAYHEERQKRCRARFEAMIAENGFCNRKKWAISEFPKGRKYLISLSFRGKASVRPAQVGGFDVNIVIHGSTAVRGRGDLVAYRWALWKLTAPWTHRTRPPHLGKRCAFSTSSTGPFPSNHSRKTPKGPKIALGNPDRPKKCKGTLVIKEPTGQGGMILGSSLVCDKCGYEKYPSPEYASCEQADQFLDAAVKLDGTPPFPATHNAFQACELYLRELGGFYYYIDESDEGEFQSPSNKHSLSNLRNRLLKPRRDRLDAKHFDGQNFLVLLQKLPDGLWKFLRYREPVLVFPHVAENPEPSIGEDGRLLVNGTDVYEVLIRMGRLLKKFVLEEFRAL